MGLRIGVVLASVVALATAVDAQAATFAVTRTDDPVPGACDSDCSLREAVLAVDAGSGGDTISLPAGHYRLGIAGTGEDAAARGDLDLTKSVTIAGAGARATTIDALGLDRVLDVASGVSAAISDVTVTGGQATGDGGGIRSAGTLTLLRDSVAGNHAAGVGGGIASTGPSLTLANSTVSANQASIGGGVSATVALTVTSSTISGNVAGGPGSIMGTAGGVSGGLGSTVTLRSSTVAGNQSFAGPGSGGGIEAPAPRVQNTILAQNVALAADQSTAAVDNCASPTASQGNNLSDGADCGLTQPGDRQGTAVALGPLADNGGPTDTQAVLAGSAALDTGAGCPSTDQRGAARPRGSACDVGAYEAAPPAATTAEVETIGRTSVLVHGIVDPNVRLASFGFQYGPTIAYGTTTPGGWVPPGLGITPVSVRLTDVRPGIVYHVRITATNADGTAVGADQTFQLDRKRPVLGFLRAMPGIFRAQRGTTFEFKLSEQATVTFKFDRVKPGARRKGKCLPRTKYRRGPACTRYLPLLGSLETAGQFDANRYAFAAKLRGKAFAPGAYRLRAVARDAGENVSKTAVAAFRVVR
jgi:CSLREA domain-containing protein